MTTHTGSIGACFELRNCLVQVFELFFRARDQTRVGLDIGARSRDIDVVARAELRFLALLSPEVLDPSAGMLVHLQQHRFQHLASRSLSMSVGSGCIGLSLRIFGQPRKICANLRSRKKAFRRCGHGIRVWYVCRYAPVLLLSWARTENESRFLRCAREVAARGRRGQACRVQCIRTIQPNRNVIRASSGPSSRSSMRPIGTKDG